MIEEAACSEVDCVLIVHLPIEVGLAMELIHAKGEAIGGSGILLVLRAVIVMVITGSETADEISVEAMQP